MTTLATCATYVRRYGFNGNTLSLPTLMCGYELVWVYFGE